MRLTVLTELDINRAESCAKRLQKEFEREFETVGACRDILTKCGGDQAEVAEETKVEDAENPQEVELEPGELPPGVFGEISFTVSATQKPFGG